MTFRYLILAFQKLNSSPSHGSGVGRVEREYACMTVLVTQEDTVMAAMSREWTLS